MPGGFLLPARIEEQGRSKRQTAIKRRRLQISWSFSVHDKLWEGLARWTINSVESVEVDTWPDGIIGIAKDTTRMKFFEREPKLYAQKVRSPPLDPFQGWWKLLLYRQLTTPQKNRYREITCVD